MTNREFSISTWVRGAKRRSDLLQVHMSLGFDLEGALDAHQPELAWHTRQAIIEFGLRLFLQQMDAEAEMLTDCTEVLERVSPHIAEDVWSLLLEPMPSSEEALRTRIRAALDVVELKLGQPTQRHQMIAAWADAIRSLREIGSSIGLAREDGWYLPVDSSDDWYQEVQELLLTSQSVNFDPENADGDSQT